MAIILIGALLVVAGVVYMAGAVLGRGRLSGPAPAQAVPDRSTPNLEALSPTLEPSRRGLRFFGLATNWPGLLMVVAGAVLLLSAAMF